MAREAAPGVDRSSELWKALQALTRGLGVQELDPHKSGALTPELCQLWHIDLDRDSQAIIRRKIIWQLERLFAKTPQTSVRKVSEICFNLADEDGRTVVGNLSERQKALGSRPELVGDTKKGPSKSTVQGYLNKTLDSFYLELRKNRPPLTPDEVLTPLHAGTDATTTGLVPDLSDSSSSEFTENAVVVVPELSHPRGARPFIVAGTAALVAVSLVGGAVYWRFFATASNGTRSPISTLHGNTGAAATTANLPVRIEEVKPLNTGDNNTLVVPNAIQLTSSQLASLNANHQADPSFMASFQSSIHAISTDGGFVAVTVMGNEDRTVTITGMHVVKQCTALPTGTLLYNPNAGDDTTIRLGFNLDSPIGYAQDVQGKSYTGDFFQEHVVTLTSGETHTFSIYAGSTQRYCQFYFEMSVATPGGVVSEKIDDAGHPFALTGVAGKSPGMSVPTFSAYRIVYVGGVNNPAQSGAYVQVNPKTYTGLGLPASSPP